jgi:hypothetical protein
MKAPSAVTGPLPDSVLQVIAARDRDIGGFAVGRVLPAIGRRMVGPFIFLDHMGPVTLPAGHGMDVPPHPHIGLATVTYLYAGEIFHRDSLGSAESIRPHDVNWMSAGRGIVHSERTTPEIRASGQTVHGLQAWVALPATHEDSAPTFAHHEASTLPTHEQDGVLARVIAGEAFGVRSPVVVASPTLYVDLALRAGASLTIGEAEQERALYVAQGTIEIDGLVVGTRTLAVLQPGATPRVVAATDARVALLGGAPFGEERHIWWNFVASTQARIDAAKALWRDDGFAVVPGDERERVPLPER